MMSILNGGAHADDNVDIQEFIITPVGRWPSPRRCAGRRGVPRAAVGDQAAGMSTGIDDQGGFALDLEHNRAALDLIVEAIGKAGFTPGQDIALAIDAAASELYAVGAYNFEGTS